MTRVQVCGLVVAVLITLVQPSPAEGGPAPSVTAFGRTKAGKVVTDVSLMGYERKAPPAAVLHLFSWQDTNRLAVEVSALGPPPPLTNYSKAAVLSQMDRGYNLGAQWHWRTLLLNQMMDDVSLAEAKPRLDELGKLAGLVADSELARRVLVYERSPTLSDEAYAQGWREFYARHRPKHPTNLVEQGMPFQLAGRKEWMDSNYLPIAKTLYSLREPSHSSISNQVWQEARAALVSQAMRNQASAPPPELVADFAKLFTPRYPCQCLITTNQQRAAEWLLTARQTITTNAGHVALFQLVGAKDALLIPSGKHVASLANLQEAFGPEFATHRLPRAYSIPLPHPSVLANEAAQQAYDATMSLDANIDRAFSLGSRPGAKPTGTLVLVVGSPEPLKLDEVAKQQREQLREFVEAFITRRMTEHVRSQFEWLNPDHFPNAKEMQELLFGRHINWALRGLEH